MDLAPIFFCYAWDLLTKSQQDQRVELHETHKIEFFLILLYSQTVITSNYLQCHNPLGRALWRSAHLVDTWLLWRVQLPEIMVLHCTMPLLHVACVKALFYLEIKWFRWSVIYNLYDHPIACGPVRLCCSNVTTFSDLSKILLIITSRKNNGQSYKKTQSVINWNYPITSFPRSDKSNWKGKGG